jgi:hypothetical protein
VGAFGKEWAEEALQREEVEAGGDAEARTAGGAGEDGAGADLHIGAVTAGITGEFAHEEGGETFEIKMGHSVGKGLFHQGLELTLLPSHGCPFWAARNSSRTFALMSLLPGAEGDASH